jgi:uncharacterized tellurite resistance protein B-like protein
MVERLGSFLKGLPPGAPGSRLEREDDPRVAAAALMFHVMNADGVRHDTEWERLKDVLSESFGVTSGEMETLLAAGEKADNEAIDLYAFTSVLKRHLDEEARIEFIHAMWEVVYADGMLHELEDNILWRVAELIGVDRRERVLARQEAARNAPGAIGESTDE